MKVLRQLSLILVIWAVGEYISHFISKIVAIPGSIIGMILLFLLLQFKLIRVEQIKEVSNFFLDNLAFFFVPAGVSLITSLDIIKENALILIAIIVITTAIVMYVTAYVVEKTIKIKERKSEKVKSLELE